MRSIQINIEPTKSSIGSYIDLHLDLKNSKSVLNIRSYKYNCLQLIFTAWLYPAPHHATRESKYVDKLIEPRQQHEDDFAYIIRTQKLYNISIWVYTPCGGVEVELFKQVDDLNKDREDVRILVWCNGQIEHCALIKNIETLLVRPNKNKLNYYYCGRYTYWCNSQIKYDKHECNNSFKPEIVCPMKKHITLLNEHKRQNIKNIITADIECCIVGVSTNDCKYVIAEHIPIAVGYTWQGNFKHYFGLGCIKSFARDLLEIETGNNFKRNKQMIFNEEDKLYHETNNTCHICSKICINKVRDHCHETGKYRGPACKICNLRYKEQNFIPVIFHNGSGYDFNLIYSELFKQNNDKRKVDNIPLAAVKSKMFSIGCLKFLDSYNFLAMPLDQMAKIYGCKTKTLYPYEHFGLDDYQENIGNLKIEDFKSSLHNKLPTQEEVDNFNNENSNKTGKDVTIEYLQNDMEILDYCMSEYVKLSMEEFKHNPLHYVSLPGYSFDCWLMSSGVTLDTLQDKKMLDDFVAAKRGGICGVMGDRIVNNRGTRLASHEQRSFADGETGMKSHNRNIWYIDANNLYGYAMMQKLPYKDFQFTTTTLDAILNTPDDSDDGYYIFCDIDYTNECKERTAQLALMPNKRKINDYEFGYRERDGGKARSEKLILDQSNKTEYMVHYRMLKFYVKMGVKVTNIHRVIKFKQDYIRRDYMQNNTNKRATAKTEAEKDVRK